MLRHLDTLSIGASTTPATIGYLLTPDRPVRPLWPQGAGRLGGRVLSQLVTKGLAHRVGRYTEYAISSKGKRVASALATPA